jgi:hypothetical protein
MLKKGEDNASVEIDGPFSIVANAKEGRFAEARLVRVPLESITSWEDLQRIVIKPLTALVWASWSVSARCCPVSIGSPGYID